MGKPYIGKKWLIFFDELGISSGLIERFRLVGQEIITVNKGDTFTFDNNSFTIVPDRYSDYELLIKK